MRLLLFLSRVALVCNVFFLPAVLLQWKKFISEDAAVSTLIIVGYFLAVFVFNPLVHILYLVWFIRRKRLFEVVPEWLVWTNFSFLLIQIAYLFAFT